MTEIRTSDVRAYTEARLKEGATPAGVNRELSVIKKDVSLAVKDGRLYVKPNIPMLAEHNVRKGFLEPAQFADVKAKLSPALGAGVRLSHGLAIGVRGIAP